MKRLGIHFDILAVAGIVSAFWIYGGCRTMQENVYPTLRSFSFSLVAGVLVPTATGGLALTIFHLLIRSNAQRLHDDLGLFALILILGCLLSECWIVLDEVKFATEAQSKKSSYSRARTWPNSGTSLVFVPGRGIHATD